MFSHFISVNENAFLVKVNIELQHVTRVNSFIFMTAAPTSLYIEDNPTFSFFSLSACYILVRAQRIQYTLGLHKVVI